MKMPVCIDVVERQAGRTKSFELGGNLGTNLPPHGRINCATDAEAYEIVGEASGSVDQSRNLRRWEDRVAVDQDDVKPDAQARQCAGAFDRIGRRRAADHQARRAENTAPVRLFDRGVDRLAQPEIVRCNRQPIQ